MSPTLERLIADHRQDLVDSITKDAIRQIPSYEEAPLRQTIVRVERWLDELARSIEHNQPAILEKHLINVASERRQEGYAVDELHAIVLITERALRGLILRVIAVETEHNALLALLDAVMGAARMVLSVQYLVGAARPVK
jgi:hypothetical protein